MALAREEAQRFNHDFIGTEHVLLGLIRKKDCVGVAVLENLGADLDGIRSALEKMVERGSAPATLGQLPFTPWAQKVLERAMEEAGELRHGYVGTQHLLLGLLRVKEGLASEALRAGGLNLEEVRSQVRKLFVPEESEEPEPSGRTAPPAAADSHRVLDLAAGEAERLGHGFVGLGHLLLGLLREEGPAAEILEALGITLERLEPQAERLVQFDLAAAAGRDLPLLPLAARAMLRSSHEAKTLGSKEVRTEHVLLGLLGEPDGAASRLLRELGLDLEEVRRRALRASAAQTSSEGPPS
jgi:ATP-dependent Clp protease ATP-binding subunit ClpA